MQKDLGHYAAKKDAFFERSFQTLPHAKCTRAVKELNSPNILAPFLFHPYTNARRHRKTERDFGGEKKGANFNPNTYMIIGNLFGLRSS
jgi:hypothetical protein